MRLHKLKTLQNKQGDLEQSESVHLTASIVQKQNVSEGLRVIQIKYRHVEMQLRVIFESDRRQ